MCNFHIILIILFFYSKIFLFLHLSDIQSKVPQMTIFIVFVLFLGIGYSMSILGPAVGYVLGGQLLTVYIDADLGQRQGNIYFSFI